MHKPAEKGKLLASKIGYKDVTRGVPIWDKDFGFVILCSPAFIRRPQPSSISQNMTHFHCHMDLHPFICSFFSNLERPKPEKNAQTEGAKCAAERAGCLAGRCCGLRRRWLGQYPSLGPGSVHANTPKPNLGVREFWKRNQMYSDVLWFSWSPVDHFGIRS
jgi:hypothetical protein